MWGCLQIVAYNKMDVPDSSDYWEDIQQHLTEDGVPSSDILPISAATGEGVVDLVRRLRAVLDDLPQLVRRPCNSPSYCVVWYKRGLVLPDE